MRFWFLLPVILLTGCASHPPPRVAFIYRGMKKQLMLQVMGEPAQVLTTYKGEEPHLEEQRDYQFSNSKCEGETKVVCNVWVTKEGIVYGWDGVKSIYTEDGQK